MNSAEKEQVASLLATVARLNIESRSSSSTKTDSSPLTNYLLLLRALDQFTECVRYLNTRRSSGAILSLESEADVQDALFLMLRPWFIDLVGETPTAKSENRFVIKDFLVPCAKTVIEVKFIRDKAHGKSVSEELHDDIEMYRKHPDCDRIIFFIYDPDSYIPSQKSLIDPIEVERTYDGKTLNCRVLIRP
jgi:hypothetical protein